MYVFDNSPLSVLFKNYYRARFPTLWDRFDDLIERGKIISTREVRREIDESAIVDLRSWATRNQGIFATPTSAEGAAVAAIYSIEHFQLNIEQKKLQKGGLLADPFVIAKAMTDGLAVVTMELFRPNAAKIPNICAHFGVQCMTLEGFMETEGWEF